MAGSPETIELLRYTISIAEADSSTTTDTLSTLHYTLGNSLDMQGGDACKGGDCRRMAVESWKSALLLPCPSNPHIHESARLALASGSGEKSIAGISEAYVTALFDDYAGQFERSLQALSYNTPHHLHDAVGLQNYLIIISKYLFACLIIISKYLFNLLREFTEV